MTVQDLLLAATREATYIEGGPKPVVFRKVDRPDVTINVIGDFVTCDIALEHAPKVGKTGDAYIADNLVFLWDIQLGTWVAESKVGEIWEPVPVQGAPVPEELLQQPGIFGTSHAFTMKGEWAEGSSLPEGGSQPGDCWLWRGHYWARTTWGTWKDYGDAKSAPVIQMNVLEDLAVAEGKMPHSATLLPAATLQLTEEEMRKFHPDPSKEFANLVNGDVYFWNDQKNVYRNEGPVADFKGFNVRQHVAAEQPAVTRDFNAIPTVDLSPAKAHGQAIENKEHPSLDDVSSLLESGLAKLEGEQNDVALKALGALKKVKVDLRRKRRNAWFRRAIFLLILGAIGYGLYKWIPTQVETGRYTVPKTCSVPFGNGTIQGMRYYHYAYKSLFGVHFTLESTVREETDVSKDGKEFTVFGLSPRNEAATEEEMALADKVLKTAEVEVETAPKPPKGKWWRINVWSSDKGTQWMKPAELYLFASEKYTTMVAYKDFCK